MCCDGCVCVCVCDCDVKRCVVFCVVCCVDDGVGVGEVVLWFVDVVFLCFCLV